MVVVVVPPTRYEQAVDWMDGLVLKSVVVVVVVVVVCDKGPTSPTIEAKSIVVVVVVVPLSQNRRAVPTKKRYGDILLKGKMTLR